MRTIAVINQKGGVGKTTTTVNLGAGLARLGRRVLLIDLDPQANLTSHLERDGAEIKASIYDVLRSGAALVDAAVPAGPDRLWLIPSAGDLAAAEIELAAEIGRESILRDALQRCRAAGAPFDYVLIDCPPSLGLLALNALVAADEALVPIQAEFFALSGMARFVEVKDVVHGRLNPRLELGGIVICMWKGQANLSREVQAEVQRVFGSALYETVIRQNVKLAEAPSAGRTIFEYAPESNGAADYEQFANEFLARHADSPAPPLVAPPLVAQAEEGQILHKAEAPPADEGAAESAAAEGARPVSAGGL